MELFVILFPSAFLICFIVFLYKFLEIQKRKTIEMLNLFENEIKKLKQEIQDLKSSNKFPKNWKHFH
jgi:hypothetical protein